MSLWGKLFSRSAEIAGDNAVPDGTSPQGDGNTGTGAPRYEIILS